VSAPPRTSPGASFLLLVVVASAFNIAKPVHIDDAAHLFIAEAIVRDPVHASAALVNWDQLPEPIHALNIPHLLMYVFAAALKLGASNVALHGVLAAFTALALFLVWRLAALFVPGHALWVTAAVALGPAFLPAQNLMADIPTLAMWAGFFLCMALADREEREVRDWQACAFLAVGCLLKYASLVLVPAFVVLVIRRRKWRSLRALVLPAVALIGWSAFTWVAYGGVHLLERAGALANPEDGGVLAAAALCAGRLPLWVEGVGALSPFSLAFIQHAGRRALAWCAVAGAVVIAVGLAIPFRSFAIFAGTNELDAVLRGLFFANGLLVVVLLRKSARKLLADRVTNRGAEVVVAWLATAVALTVFLAPFPAARHVLMATPPILVLLVAAYPPGAAWSRIGLATTVCLGALLAISDWRRANVYRVEASSLASASHTTWTVGHWGWQWYAARAGMRDYAPGQTKLAAGDILIEPQTVHRQRISPKDAATLRLVDEVRIAPSLLDRVRTVTAAGGLYYYWAAVPWTIRSTAVETFKVFEVSASSRTVSDTR